MAQLSLVAVVAVLTIGLLLLQSSHAQQQQEDSKKTWRENLANHVDDMVDTVQETLSDMIPDEIEDQMQAKADAILDKVEDLVDEAVPDEWQDTVEAAVEQVQDLVTAAGNNNSSSTHHNAVDVWKHVKQRFKQRLKHRQTKPLQGWDRLRNVLGLGLGLSLLFHGDTQEWWKQGGAALAVQGSVVVWEVMNDYFSSLWIPDVVSTLLGVSSWQAARMFQLPESMKPQMLAQAALPAAFLTLMLYPCWDLVVELWTSQSEAPVPTVVVATALTIGSLYLVQIPLSLAASAMAGALLVWDSLFAEVTGHWLVVLQGAMGAMFPVGALALFSASSSTEKPGEEDSPLATAKKKVQKLWKNPFVKKGFGTINRVRKAVRDVFVPVALMAWGISVQLELGLFGALRLLTLNPLSAGYSMVRWLFQNGATKGKKKKQRSPPKSGAVG